MSAPFKLVHAADVHLDTRYRRRGDALRERLQEAGRAAFAALVDLAIEERADALLIAGDLFDNEWLTVATERALTEDLARLTAAGVTAVYATGNHDPGRANYRAANIAWPAEGFHLVRSRQAERIPIERGGETVGWVVAAGHVTQHETENLAAEFPPAPGPQPAAALLHADVQGTAGAPDDESGRVYAPAQRADLGRGYAYWALGHIHQRQQVNDDPPAWYAGNLQGRDFGETGAKGALVVELSPPAPPQIRFHPLARVRWETLTAANLGHASSISDVQTAVRAEVECMRADDRLALPDQEWIVRVELRGPCPLAELLRDEAERDDLADYLRQSLGALDVEVRDAGLHPPIELERYAGQRHVLGVALALIEQARCDDSQLAQLTPQTLALGDAHPDGPERRAYLRQLLDGLDAAAAERLLRKDAT